MSMSVPLSPERRGDALGRVQSLDGAAGHEESGESGECPHTGTGTALAAGTSDPTASCKNNRASPGTAPCRIPLSLEPFTWQILSVWNNWCLLVSNFFLNFINVRSTSLIRILAYLEFTLHRLTWNAAT